MTTADSLKAISTAELEALVAATRARDLVEIVADSLRSGEIDMRWALELIVEAGGLAARASGPWPFLDERSGRAS
jgi:hypothetical protein